MASYRTQVSKTRILPGSHLGARSNGTGTRHVDPVSCPSLQDQEMSVTCTHVPRCCDVPAGQPASTIWAGDSIVHVPDVLGAPVWHCTAGSSNRTHCKPISVHSAGHEAALVAIGRCSIQPPPLGVPVGHDPATMTKQSLLVETGAPVSEQTVLATAGLPHGPMDLEYECLQPSAGSQR